MNPIRDVIENTISQFNYGLAGKIFDEVKNLAFLHLIIKI